MYYTVRHVTKFRYSAPISESIMEVRIQPRSEGNQYCLDFRLHTNPRAHVSSYRGEFGNRVHHFDVPNYHSQLTITAESLVDVTAPPELPEALTSSAWEELDKLTATDEYWDLLMPSQFTQPTELLLELARDLHVERRDDPLTVLRDLNRIGNVALVERAMNLGALALNVVQISVQVAIHDLVDLIVIEASA